MGGGKERKASQNMQTDIAKQQLEMGQKQMALSQGELSKRNELQQPSIDFYQRMISGDPSLRLQAAAPVIGDISKGARSARESIYDTVPRGAARDAALAQIPMQQNAATTEQLNKMFLNAFPALSQIGTEAGQVGLQQTGAGFRGIEGAGNTNAQVMEQQMKQKQATLGMIGSLAGMGANIATGGMGGTGLLSFMKKSGGTPGASTGSYVIPGVNGPAGR